MDNGKPIMRHMVHDKNGDCAFEVYVTDYDGRLVCSVHDGSVYHNTPIGSIFGGFGCFEDMRLQQVIWVMWIYDKWQLGDFMNKLFKRLQADYPEMITEYRSRCVESGIEV